MRSPFLIFALAVLCWSPLSSNGQCPAGENEVWLTIETGTFSNEIYWRLTDGFSIIDSTAPNTYPTNNTVYDPTYLPKHKQCLDTATLYEFEAWDSFGDGWNGGTYEWVDPCSGNIIINNNGQVPNNGIACNQGPCAEAVESFNIPSCVGFDLALTAISGDSKVCGGDYTYTFDVANLGLTPSNTYSVWAVLNGDSQHVVINTPLGAGQTTPVPLGPFNIQGNPTGLTYPMVAWVDHPYDFVPTNNQQTGLVVEAFEQTPHQLTNQFSNLLAPNSNGSIITQIAFCDSTISQLDACFRIGHLNIDTLVGPGLTGLAFTLWSPAGTSLNLSNGGISNLPEIHNMGWSDTATSGMAFYATGTFKPQEQVGFAKFYGEDPNGTWTLVIDQPNMLIPNMAGLKQWSLTFEEGPIPNLGPDTAICGSSTYQTPAQPGFSTYWWSNGSTLEQPTFTTSGTYTVTTTDAYGCTHSDSVAITFLETVVTGYLTGQQGQALQNAKVLFLDHDPVQNVYFPVDSVFTDSLGFYSNHVSQNAFWLRVIPDLTFNPLQIPAYYYYQITANQANQLQGNASCDTIIADFSTPQGINGFGPGTISGFLTECDNGMPGAILPNHELFLMESLNPICGSSYLDRCQRLV